ncbi:MAG: hypothetical protein LC768_12420, partial [Acidobacteria bacterium]|nr:hypothetical protein [Acidobacteriota bacterium]MCA1639116.1 hypothetical protein [Acidobacteriota bacterium]
AYSNYDRDPGDADITEIPVSFQVGLSDHVELFFNTDAYRAVKINSPRNLSGFYLPNSQLRIGNALVRPGAVVLGTGPFAGRAVFRPQNPPFNIFPFVGGGAGVVGLIGAPTGGGNGASNFPGLGSVFGSILPGVVLQTTTVTVGGAPLVAPTVFTLAPSYLPDAPFINREYGESAFNTFTVGGKIRFTGPNNPYGIGIIPFYRFYADRASTNGFNQLQRGASPGGGGPEFYKNENGRGDFGLVLFGDARVAKWLNASANIGYIYNSSVKGNAANTSDVTFLDRPDEVLAGVALDFPVNKFFQPILEFRSTHYVGGRTPNAFENSPLDGLAGARFYPARWFSIGAAYRHHFNQQDAESLEDNGAFTTNTRLGATTTTNNFTGVPPGFRTSSDPHGFIVQITAGRRNARTLGQIPNQFANVTNLEVSETRVTIPCGPDQRPAEGANCSDDMVVNVTTTAVDPENDVLTYNYTVSGGRIVGQGASVTWDLTGAAPGSYTITAGVDDGCGVCGQTQTRTVVVENCNCVAIRVPCECPTLTVSGPTGEARPGDVLTFTATTTGGNAADLTYSWTVTPDTATIAEGQGTPTIRVQTTPEMVGQNITATVTVSSTVCPECNRSESATFSFPAPPESVLFATVGAVPADELRGILDNYFIELQNDPTSRGVIINSGPAREVARRETLIRNHIRFRRFDATRIEFIRGADTGTIETRLYRVPAGATPPTP